MKILLLYPKFPETFWGFKYALPFIGKKAVFPPLGLLTVAALLPADWEKRAVDLNTQKLDEKDLNWADFVFISAMIIQKKSVMEIINLAKKLGKKIVAGGPLFTTGSEEFLEKVDHLVLGEAEVSLPLFLEDFKKGSLKRAYRAEQWPDIKKTPIPLWELIDMRKYSSMGVQYSRGCPFNCEFCDIILLNGRTPRAKDKDQILKELDALYNRGWRESVFFVDDNFIGNKIKLKAEVLPAIIRWMEEKNYPFVFNTQVSINIADDDELMELMSMAGFNTVFIGIESPNEESLKECGKFQNVNRNLLESIKIIQNHGLQIQGGFIVGFDRDTPSIFDRMRLFIQKSGITTATVGLLQAFPKTRLWERLKAEKRLISQTTGDSNDTINFISKIDSRFLISGYKKFMDQLYSPKDYYQRIKTFLKEYRSKTRRRRKLSLVHFSAFLKSVWILGIREKERFYYWRVFFKILFRNPRLFPLALDMMIKGYHFRKIFESYL